MVDAFKRFSFDLGITTLFSEWKSLISKKYLASDIIAGITVGCLAIPLSLAIALASGVSPGTGLITAVVAGIVCGLFGGAPLSVSGPAAAMTVLVADTVERFGVEALVLLCLMAGLMQLISGICGLGRLARYVPIPVIAGFTSGIGVIILIGQLPRVFGLEPPAEAHIFSVFNHIKDYIHEANAACFLLVVTTLIIIRWLPKLLPKVPSILPAVVIVTTLAWGFHLKNIPLIGDIPNSLPAPHLPNFIQMSFRELFINSFSIYLLASLETLLSASALDKLTHNKKHDPNQELIGQGLGNIAVSLFSGIPVTSVIVRSSINVKSGAKTRRASIIHSLVILLTVLMLAPLISLIPIAALAGVLLAVACSMINYKEFYELCQTSRSEALIYAVTFFTIIFVDLIAGVQAGIAAASLIILLKAVESHLHISSIAEDDIVRISLTGSLTFLSTGKVTKFEKTLKAVDAGQTILLDLSNVTTLDSSGATAIIALYNQCLARKINFYILGLPRRLESLLKICDGDEILENCCLSSEHELRKKDPTSTPKSSRGRLIHGVNRFYQERKQNDKRLFESISKAQDPHTLFITCSDSRIVPSLITSSAPGELFIIRNVGNHIPTYQEDSPYSEAAALEFALSSFDITDIVVCGHANCGAMEACKQPHALPAKLKAWIGLIREQLNPQESLTIDDFARINVLNQISNLKSYPIVQQKIMTNSLNIHAWFFDIDNCSVYEWNAHNKEFQTLIAKAI